MKKFMISLIAAILVIACAIPAMGLAYTESDLKRVLYKDFHGEDVEMVQECLSNLGYYSGPIDGKYGKLTQQAVIDFQKANRLAPDGNFGRESWKVMISGSAVDKASAAENPYLESDFDGTLEEGSTGDNVKIVQRLLKELGYYEGEVNGKYGYSLRKAVYKFQEDNNLHHDGKVGPNTWSLLVNGGLTPISSKTNSSLVEGDMGEEVEEAQMRLAFYGYYDGEIDGKFDNKVKQAVIKFQRRNDLSADGKIGPETWAILSTDTGVKLSDPTQPIESMTLGCSGLNVEKVQIALKNNYYYNGEITGEFDSLTFKAVKNFQESAGLVVDGIVGKRTWDALVNGTASIFNGGHPVRDLRRTMRGYDVYVLQQDLVYFNYLSGYYMDGYYDDATVNAVKAFQKDNNMEETGVLDLHTRRYLYTSPVVEEDETKQAEEGTLTVRLSIGAHGTKVSDVQMRLKAGGWLLGNADGIFGEKTRAAVIALQKAYGLYPDGIIGEKTWPIINSIDVTNADPELVDPEEKVYTISTTKLYAGCRGTAVTKLQQMLSDLGYYSGDIDGKFGPLTKEAVVAFQADKGLVEDGVVGTKTYVALYDELGVNP